MRADVPTIGVPTIERLAERGASCLAIGAGRVIMIDRPAVLAAADRLKIAIVGIGEAGPEHALDATAVTPAEARATRPPASSSRARA